MASIPKIATCLWFDKNAEEAIELYTSIFDNSRVKSLSRYSKEGQEVHGGKPGSVMSIEFELLGQPFTAINGGPQFKFTEAISLQILWDSQAEIDRYWDRLLAGGGTPSQCGWLKDRFGLSWQVTPIQLIGYIADPDTTKADRAMKAMMKMGKLDLAALTRAHAG
jgi:predicted 3-demethylubiquinone-9 3-methyltransferase (glyoxalase superfamily)